MNSVHDERHNLSVNVTLNVVFRVCNVSVWMFNCFCLFDVFDFSDEIRILHFLYVRCDG